MPPHTTPARQNGFERPAPPAPHGAKIRRRPGLRRRLIRAARQAPQAAGKGLRRRIARAGEGIHLLAALHGDLGDDMGSRAKAVNAQALNPLTCHAVGAVTDQPGAPATGGFHVV